MNPFTLILNSYQISPSLGGGFPWQGTAGDLCLLLRVMADAYTGGFDPPDDPPGSAIAFAVRYVLDALSPYEPNTLIDYAREDWGRLAH